MKIYYHRDRIALCGSAAQIRARLSWLASRHEGMTLAAFLAQTAESGQFDSAVWPAAKSTISEPTIRAADRRSATATDSHTV